MREIILDTETTGFEPAKGDRLVEIGCIEVVNRMPTGAVYHQYVNPQRDMPEGAFKVHGLSEEFLSDKPLFVDVCDAFLEFIDGSPIVAHNAPFDMKFLNAELVRAKRPQFPYEQAIDTLVIAKKKFPGGSNSLNALCRRFDVDLSNRDLHGALIDADLLAQVYLELSGGRQPGLVLDSAGAKRAEEGGLAPGAQRKERPQPLKSRLEGHEAEAHAKFIAESLGGEPLWLKSGA
jgi:DNA polymerase-3 subunit epsilon